MKIEHVKIHGKGNRLGFVDSKTSEFVNVLLGFRRSHGRPPDSLAAERESLRLLLSNADTNSHFKKKTQRGPVFVRTAPRTPEMCLKVEIKK